MLHSGQTPPTHELITLPDGQYAIPMGNTLRIAAINSAYSRLRMRDSSAAARVEAAYERRWEEWDREEQERHVWQSVIEDWMSEDGFDMDAVDAFLDSTK